MSQVRSLDVYKIILYRQEDGAWVAEVPAIAGCYALMPSREEALAELGHVKILRQLGIPPEEFERLR